MDADQQNQNLPALALAGSVSDENGFAVWSNLPRDLWIAPAEAALLESYLRDAVLALFRR